MHRSSGTSCREVPDVSADADILTGYSIYYNRRWSIFGGTSAAAPTWAALAALANASVACTGKTVGFANPALYQAARSDYGTYFNDVTAGNNSYGGLTGFTAGTGYDMASGLGSPKGAAVAAVLCGSTWTPPAPPPAPAPTPTPRPPVVTLTRPAAQTARVGQPVRLPLHATDSAGRALTYRATGLPAGLSVAGSTGLITGSPSRAGKATATITVTDTSGSTAQAAVAWTVAGRPTITGGLSVNAQGRPSLALRVGAGSNAPPIQSIVVVPSRQIRFAKRTRDLSRGITVRNGSGHRLKSAAKLRGGDLVVTLRTSAVRSASLRVTVPAITLIKAKKALSQAPRRRRAAEPDGHRDRRLVVPHRLLCALIWPHFPLHRGKWVDPDRVLVICVRALSRHAPVPNPEGPRWSPHRSNQRHPAPARWRTRRWSRTSRAT